MTCFCCCTKSLYRSSASVGPFQGLELYSQCRLEYLNSKRYLNVLHLQPEHMKPVNQQSNKSKMNQVSLDQKSDGHKASVSSVPPVVQLVDDNIHDESDSEPDYSKSQILVVKVDLERPQTNETVTSRLSSLPPISIGSPAHGSISLTKHFKRFKLNLLPKRQVPVASFDSKILDTAEYVADQNSAAPSDVYDGHLSTTINETGDRLTPTNVTMQEAQANPVKPSRLSVFKLKRKSKIASPIKRENADAIEPCAMDVIQPSNEIVIEPGSLRRDDFEEEKRRSKSTVSFGGSSLVRKPAEPSQFVMFFIHGVGGNLKVWQKQLVYFNEKGFELVAIDLIGHGGSSAPRKRSEYNFEAIKADVIGIFDKYAKEHNIVVAHSYGTCFAAILSRERQNKVSHLIFVSSGGPVPLDPDDGPFGLPTPILAILRPFIDKTFKKLAFSKVPTSETFKRAFGVRTGVLKRVMQGQHWANGDVAYHQMIAVPTLLIFGNLDELVTLEEMNEMRKAIPDSHLEVIENASHMVMLEAEDAVNRLIEKFINLTPISAHEVNGQSLDDDNKIEFRPRRVHSATTYSRSLPPSKAFRIQSARRR